MQVINGPAPRMVRRSERLLAIALLDSCKRDAGRWRPENGGSRFLNGKNGARATILGKRPPCTVNYNSPASARPASGGCRFEYTKWTIFGLHLALHEPVRFHAEKFDSNFHRTLKWSPRRGDHGGAARGT